jgi:hypothetical protein
MHRSGNKKIPDMESPGFWFLLVIPATIAIMAYQYRENPPVQHSGTLVSQPSVMRFDTTPAASPPAFGDPRTIRRAGASGNDGGNAGKPPAHTEPVINTDVPAPSISDRSMPTDPPGHPEARTTTGQGSSIDIAAGSGVKGTEGEAAGVLSSRAATDQGPNADLVSILDENPYLPVVEEDYLEPGIADNTISSMCPETLFRGGNDYAILRLTLMGCDIPGS